MAIVKSNRNADQVFFSGYLYSKQKVLTTYIKWKCRSIGCRAWCKTPINYLENQECVDVIGEHNHQAATLIDQKKRKIDEMKKLIEKAPVTPKHIISAVIEGSDRRMLEALGCFENIKSLLRLHREAYFNPAPYLYPDIKINERLSKTVINTPFYRFGLNNYGSYQENENFLIFFSDFALEKLNLEKMWCVDGTFKSVPAPYYQLFTISFIKNDHVFPSIYCIMKNKQRETYEALLDQLIMLGVRPSDQIIKCDYEMAIIKALETKFPNSRISTCMFHLGQMIWRRIQTSGLESHYKTNPTVRKFTKYLSALALVKSEYVNILFSQILMLDDFPNVIYTIYHYFFENLLGNDEVEARYRLSLWNSEDILNVPRTNNAVEGWHHSLNSSFHNSTTNLPLLIQKLRTEEDWVRMKWERMDLGHSFPKKQTYKDQEDRLLRYLEVHRESRFGLDYLNGLVERLYYIQ